MFESIKKSAIITKDNPILTLSFVIYLIIISFILPKLAIVQNNSVLFYIFVFTIFVFATAFFAGWFGMIRQTIVNSKKTYESEESKILDTFGVRTYFFPSIANYILPLLSVFLLYYVLFVLWTLLNIKIANHFIGPIDFLFNDLRALEQSKEATLAYLSNLPNSKLVIIYGWQALFSVAFFIYSALTVFWVSALYYAKNDSKNPFLALWSSVSAIFRNPFGVIGINIFVAAVVMIFMLLSKPFSINAILSFIYMILAIYLAVYINVLIFNYYEKKLANNCDNGCDSIGENKEGDSSSETL